jgi:hypothetical protein
VERGREGAAEAVGRVLVVACAIEVRRQWSFGGRRSFREVRGRGGRASAFTQPSGGEGGAGARETPGRGTVVRRPWR